VHQLTRRLVRRPGPAPVVGAGAGAAFWAINYWVVAPISGLMPPPDRDRPDRPLVMLIAHLVWGAISAVLGDRLARPAAPARRPAAREVRPGSGLEPLPVPDAGVAP
jgi:hypothetical protein